MVVIRGIPKTFLDLQEYFEPDQADLFFKGAYSNKDVVDMQHYFLKKDLSKFSIGVRDLFGKARAAAELMTCLILDSHSQYYILFNSVNVTPVIDHVVVNSGGVYIIRTKEVSESYVLLNKGHPSFEQIKLSRDNLATQLEDAVSDIPYHNLLVFRDGVVTYQDPDVLIVGGIGSIPACCRIPKPVLEANQVQTLAHILLSIVDKEPKKNERLMG